MKEIKYRAWYTPFENSKHGQKMKYGRAGSLLTHVEMSPDKYKLMQYTGLKDKNGVEIFEGDIIGVHWSTIAGEPNYNIFLAKNPFDYNVKEIGFFNFSDEIEIIGNIHEHPHLLEGASE